MDVLPACFSKLLKKKTHDFKGQDRREIPFPLSNVEALGEQGRWGAQGNAAGPQTPCLAGDLLLHFCSLASLLASLISSSLLLQKTRFS